MLKQPHHTGRQRPQRCSKQARSPVSAAATFRQARQRFKLLAHRLHFCLHIAGQSPELGVERLDLRFKSAKVPAGWSVFAYNTTPIRTAARA